MHQSYGMKYLFFRILLFPLTIFYFIAITIRNSLYQAGILKSIKFEVVVISVGNLRAGGTGKTPMVEYLVRLLSGKYNLCTLSRGYRRRTTGFRLADENDTATTLGDEPYQYFLKFRTVARVAVGEDRGLAIPEIMAELPPPAVIVMDDAYQHRSVKPLLNILLTSYHDPFYRDYILPAGMLREPRKCSSRSDCIVVTRCPSSIDETEMETVSKSIRQFAGHGNIFFSSVIYDEARSLSGESKLMASNILLVTAISDAGDLLDYLRRNYNVVNHLQYGDHHRFTPYDCLKIRKAYEKTNTGETAILVTEKDMVKLNSPDLKEYLESLPMFYIPIRIKFVKDGNKFDSMILSEIDKFSTAG